ncbi:MAG TPA: hypothetical protein VK037_05085 [Pseudogracilibacillus sp.]|nr:hypothetical protein [Pseudogracilibacillus sp.]
MRKLAILFVLLFIMIIGPFFWSIYQKEDEINEEKTPNIEEEKIETEDNDRKIEIGIYKGKVDEQTIEIETDEGTSFFFIDKKIETQLESIRFNDEIVYSYYEKSEERFIEFIEEYWRYRENNRKDDSLEP